MCFSSEVWRTWVAVTPLSKGQGCWTIGALLVQSGLVDAAPRERYSNAAANPACVADAQGVKRVRRLLGHTHPQYGWDFPEENSGKFWKDPGNALVTFPEIPLEGTAGIPKAL